MDDPQHDDETEVLEFFASVDARLEAIEVAVAIIGRLALPDQREAARASEWLRKAAARLRRENMHAQGIEALERIAVGVSAGTPPGKPPRKP